MPLWAHAAPDAGQILNEQQQTRPPEPRRNEPPVVKLPEAALPATVASGLQVQLRSVRFSGGTGMASDAELQALVQPALGKTLGHAELQRLADDVTQSLRARGFVLARAYLPRQDVTAGDLEIVLLDGRLQHGPGRVVVKAETRMPAERLAAVANAALPDGPLRGDDLERAVLLLNDLPGMSARSTLEPGDSGGTSKLAIEAHEGSPYAGGVTLDNFASRSTGSERLGGHFEWNDPLKIGDALGLLAYATTGTDALAVNYGAPLTPGGWRLNAAASTLHYRVGGDLQALALKGSADTVSIGASYALLRTRERNAALQLGYEHTALRDDGNGANLRHRHLDNLTLGLSGNRFDAVGGGGVTDAALQLTAGRLDLSGNAADRSIDANSAHTDGTFRKASLRASRSQSFEGAWSDWTLYGGVSGQLARGNLDSSQKFILGGPSGVRAYALGEAPADEGVLATVELRRNLNLGLAASTQGLLFIDSGRVRLHHATWAGSVANAGNANTYGLSGVGFGLNVSAGAWSLRSAVAHAVGTNAGRNSDGTDADGRTGRTRAWLQAALSF
jgi:hemolysin activation/secretion protein